MKQIRITFPAKKDYLETLAWFEEQQPELIEKFDSELAELFEEITQRPENFRKVSSTVRKARMPRFKFGVYFTIERDEIGVLAIYHPSRNPDTLRRRLR